MEKTTLSIANISCGHCTGSIENELKQIAGVSEVTGSVGDKSVTVTWDSPATLDKILAVLKEINYPAAL